MIDPETSRLAAYEGLVHAAAARYAPIMDLDADDIKQELRIKIWRLLCAFDPVRSQRQDECDFVFQCLRNHVKDMLKSQYRRNEARGGSQLFLADMSDVMMVRIERTTLSVSHDEVYAEVDEGTLVLPSTLSEFEQSVVVLLVNGYSQAEVGRELECERRRVRIAYESIRKKMADWSPGRSEQQTRVAA